MSNKLLTCIAIDDEPEALEVIKIHFDKISFVDLKACFTHPLKAVEFLQKQTVDFILLDIQMPDISGIKLTKSLQEAHLIIFTTAYPEFAVDSYNLDAVDYLVKPIVLDRLLKALAKVKRLMDSNERRTDPGEFMFLKSGNGQVRVRYDEIMYLESDGNYVNFVTQANRYISRISLAEMQQKLPTDKFMRIHKSYLINLKYLRKIETLRLSLDEVWLPVGRKYKETINAYLDNSAIGN